MGNGIAPSFVRYSSQNTAKNVETMGVLFGKPTKDGAKVKCKKLLLLKQTGDATRCALTTEGETQLGEALMEAVDGEAAIGLIHTHPRHDLFLSSIDQHNLYKFQRDCDVAVSAVYSGMQHKHTSKYYPCTI